MANGNKTIEIQKQLSTIKNDAQKPARKKGVVERPLDLSNIDQHSNKEKSERKPENRLQNRSKEDKNTLITKAQSNGTKNQIPGTDNGVKAAVAKKKAANKKSAAVKNKVRKGTKAKSAKKKSAAKVVARTKKSATAKKKATARVSLAKKKTAANSKKKATSKRATASAKKTAAAKKKKAAAKKTRKTK